MSALLWIVSTLLQRVSGALLQKVFMSALLQKVSAGLCTTADGVHTTAESLRIVNMVMHMHISLLSNFARLVSDADRLLVSQN